MKRGWLRDAQVNVVPIDVGARVRIRRARFLQRQNEHARFIATALADERDLAAATAPAHILMHGAVASNVARLAACCRNDIQIACVGCIAPGKNDVSRIGRPIVIENRGFFYYRFSARTVWIHRPKLAVLDEADLFPVRRKGHADLGVGSKSEPLRFKLSGARHRGMFRIVRLEQVEVLEAADVGGKDYLLSNRRPNRRVIVGGSIRQPRRLAACGRRQEQVPHDGENPIALVCRQGVL